MDLQRAEPRDRSDGKAALAYSPSRRDRGVASRVDLRVAQQRASASSFKFDDGSVAYTWRRVTDKYKNDLFIKSDERCVITMLSDRTGQVIQAIGTVDDSLGAFRLSYCAEQFGW